MLCPYCCADMDEPEEVNGMYVFPWHCDACGAAEIDWRDCTNEKYSAREKRVCFQYGSIPSPNAQWYPTLTLKEYLEELVWHVNSSSK